LLVNLKGREQSRPASFSERVDRIGIVQSGGLIMPAKSKAQQKAAGAALSAKRGETKRSELKGASRQMYDSMSEKQLDEFASTKRKGKPDYTPDSPIPAKKAKRKRAAKKAAATRAKNTAKRKTAAKKGAKKRAAKKRR
jgi:hypothetical protein